MAETSSTQTCPYCGYEEDESNSHWGEDSETVNCSDCGEEYSVVAHYHFMGFETQKICQSCNEPEEECYCTIEDDEREE